MGRHQTIQLPEFLDDLENTRTHRNWSTEHREQFDGEVNKEIRFLAEAPYANRPTRSEFPKSHAKGEARAVMNALLATHRRLWKVRYFIRRGGTRQGHVRLFAVTDSTEKHNIWLACYPHDDHSRKEPGIPIGSILERLKLFDERTRSSM